MHRNPPRRLCPLQPPLQLDQPPLSSSQLGLQQSLPAAQQCGPPARHLCLQLLERVPLGDLGG